MKRTSTIKITRTYHIEGAPENVPERILWLRHDSGMKQQELADAIGTTRSNLANKEKSGAGWSCEQLEAIRELFNVNMNWLFTGKGRPYRKANST